MKRTAIKQPWQKFSDKIKMVDKGEQKVFSGCFCLCKPEELDATNIREGMVEVLDKSKK